MSHRRSINLSCIPMSHFVFRRELSTLDFKLAGKRKIVLRRLDVIWMIFGAYTYDRNTDEAIAEVWFSSLEGFKQRPIVYYNVFLMATRYMYYPNMNCLVLSTVCKEYINMEVAHQEVRLLEFRYSSILLLLISYLKY